jgi:hypothetical protein
MPGDNNSRRRPRPNRDNKMKHPPSDLVEIIHESDLATFGPERRKLVGMRDQAGAIDIRVTVHARPAGEGAWRPIKPATRVYRVHSAMNAEQLIRGGPVAGRHFTATRDLLEFYEARNRTPQKGTV